ncbi:MAG: primosomal protein N' [Flavobacterium sp.]|nr:primosomal protein N' [Candidatus Neoflavobacterium equi]
MSHFVEVILPLPLPKTFTYAVNESEFNFIEPGMRVAVPFGKSKTYTALVVDVHRNKPETYDAKDILVVIDEQPLVNDFQIKLWKWISSYYMCGLGDVYKTALPSSFILESETLITHNFDQSTDISILTDDEYLVYQALQLQSSLRLTEVEKIVSKKNVFPLVKDLIEKGIIFLEDELIDKYKPKQVRYIKLHPDFETADGLQLLLDQLGRSQKQKEVVLRYFQLQATTKKPISVKDLIELSESNSTVIKAIVDKGFFVSYFLQEDRVTFKDATQTHIELSDAQQKALDDIILSFEDFNTTLLHGVTASGKTEIYIKLIEQMLQSGKQVLYLLPEIALTTQLVQRLVAYFGNQVAVYHSKYSNNERVEVWNQVLSCSEKARIVIGARSALFLPFSNLGLIVIDEEHEQTFKQADPAPRYHARDTAIVLAHAHEAKVLLGSATPSVETFFNTEQKKYGIVTLNQRFSNVVLPDIELVDIKDKQKRKRMQGHFSDTLIDAIADTLAEKKQVILFQNRRGFSPFVECKTCGHVPHCPSCDVSLTYYKSKYLLKCHYCGYSMSNPSHCPACTSTEITTKGFGTEQIELELNTLFPETKLARMDQDTTKGKHAFEKLIDSFKNREVDILVGTQMLAKGLHFDHVNLVGIMNADNMLHIPDFRSNERAYQLMVQVAGRAGRAGEKGKVLIQTYNPYHSIIQQVMNNDYTGMYKEQVYERRNFKYPPYFRLIKLTLKHKDYDKLKEGSLWLYQNLKHQLQLDILGPEEPGINRIRNEYIRTILIKIPNNAPLGAIKGRMSRVLVSFESIGAYRSIKTSINVDFY